jgi:hypothetical protein
MPEPHELTPDVLKRLKDAKWTYERIGKEYGLTGSGVQQRARSLGLIRPQSSHKDAIPWTLAAAHKNSGPAKTLRHLSLLAQKKPLHATEQLHQWWSNEAINKANEIIDAGLDVDYDKEKPPNDFSPKGGFYLRKADPKNWHIKKLMQRVISAQTRKL